MHKPVALVLLVAYSALVAHLTLTDASQGRWAFDLADRIALRASGGGLTWTQTEVIANVALFVPMGFLLAVAVGRVWPAVSLCLLASAGIEWFQTTLSSRVPTLDDVVHNTAGGLVGAVVAGLVLAAGGRTPVLTAAR